VLRLSWRPERRDFAEAFRARTRARKAWRKVWALVGLVLVIALVLFATGGDRSLASALVFAGVCAPVAGLVVQPISAWALWRRNPALHYPLQAQVDPATGITLSGPSAGHHPWSAVHSFLETDRVFVVQLAGYRMLPFFLLAKRGLAHDQSGDELRAVLSLGAAGSASSGRGRPAQ
jgi:hypothetical protein